jgi:thiol-disulfide isomerase/thioredoxin
MDFMPFEEIMRKQIFKNPFNLKKMKKYFLLCLCSLFASTVFAQNRKINFNENGEWKQVVSKARKSNKLIFIDCYTTWCGPCKVLAEKIFTRDSVADYYNATFVNVAYDMEKGEGKALAKKYDVKVFPTMLYIDPKTEEIAHRIAGAGDVNYILDNGKRALDPQTNLAALAARYESGEKNFDTLTAYLQALSSFIDKNLQTQPTIDYLNNLSDEELAEDRNWELLKENVNDILSSPLQRILNNRPFFEKTIGKEAVNEKISNTYRINVEEFQLLYQTGPKPNFNYERFDKLLNFVTSVEDENAPCYATQLYLALYAQKEDYLSLINTLSDVLKYNLLQGQLKNIYIMMNLTKLSKATGEKDRELSLHFIDHLITTTSDPLAKTTYRQIKGILLESYGDKEGAGRS